MATTFTTGTELDQNATQRVNNSAALTEYQDIILSYDWTNQADHLQWVATAPESEIIAWAKDIRRDEE